MGKSGEREEEQGFRERKCMCQDKKDGEEVRELEIALRAAGRGRAGNGQVGSRREEERRAD